MNDEELAELHADVKAFSILFKSTITAGLELMLRLDRMVNQPKKKKRGSTATRERRWARRARCGFARSTLELTPGQTKGVLRRLLAKGKVRRRENDGKAFWSLAKESLPLPFKAGADSSSWGTL